MPYRLGIDLGTTFTAAAICRQTPDRTVHTELVMLGARSAAVPSVLFFGPDTVLVGAAAERRAVTDPDLVVREFKRRIGDEVPILVGDTPHEAHDLAATLVRWVVDRVIEREGGPPDAVAVTHPASWGPHRIAVLRGALGDVELEEVVLLTEPQAAAVQYASAARVSPGATIAVYDLGGGTFDAAVVRKTAGGFELLGSPHGLDRVGGIDFDDAVVSHVLGAESGCDDPIAMARLRRECTEAKEALSTDTEATIPVLFPGATSQVTVTRTQFESLISPVLADTVDALARTIASAEVAADDVDAVLLVGGSSRIPLVEQVISTKLGRPVAVDTDPKSVIALGAALAAHQSTVPDPDGLVPVPRRPDHDCTPPELTRPRRRLHRTKVFLGTFIMLVLALAVIPSPFTADTSPPARDNSAPAQADQPGAQAGNPAQPGTTKKRPPRPTDATNRDNPGQPNGDIDGDNSTDGTGASPRAPGPASATSQSGGTASPSAALRNEPTAESATTPDSTPSTGNPTGSAPSEGDATVAEAPPPPPPAVSTADAPAPTATEEPPPPPAQPAPALETTAPAPAN
ncbi:hypothetical protein ALI144C_23035 [Actinosynnema sp. ALI-1.44]|uniref:Hsp70 family protein n=1 Tax=Actinosynnema sp. ALI-1.44 TaxID=1933779 RepID=UPI00097BF788|nr:Hsp70 family protein [Actinosynnema sp. ALI-1.44]ONI79650.1 hypothetical protein ALI144C_23035 [Actinosynnema sp. ALI-1.44]